MVPHLLVESSSWLSDVVAVLTLPDAFMDAAYLKSTVGAVLANALAFVATQQPEDPIECIANFLRKHSSNTVARNNV